MMGPMDLKERYRLDANFKAMVDQLCAFMIQAKVQPYEVRDAAFVAELIYRERISTPLYFDSEAFSCAVLGDKK